MSLTGILLDVSRSMEENIGSGVDEEGGPWARSIFKVIDDLIEHDLTSKNRVFAVGVGADCTPEIFDIIGTLQEIEKLEKCSDERNRLAIRSRINEILDILEKNGARNIRKWVPDATLIENKISEKMAEVALQELQCNEKFRKKFVEEFLPPSCREFFGRSPAVNRIQPVPSHGSAFSRTEDFHRHSVAYTVLGSLFSFGISPAFSWAEDTVTWGVSCFKTATGKDINEVVKKAKNYILKDVEIATRHFFKELGRQSIFSVQEASRIIRGCVDENELTTERMKELLKNVEPFIYGRTPLYESLEKAKELFKTDNSEHKLLFVLSDGEPTDGPVDANRRIKQITYELSSAGVKVVSCFVTRSTDIDPKRLYDEMQPGWKPGAKFLFSLSSHVPTQHLPRAIMVERKWKIDIDNNETKLFIQVNHPNNLRFACDLANDLVCSSEALSELLVSVNLDIYISQTNSNFKAKDQGNDGTCYAFASAAVLHMAMKRIHGRKGGHPEFEELKDEMIGEYGKDGADTKEVLSDKCRKYGLYCREVPIKEAKEAISEKRPVVTTFKLAKEEQKALDKFYDENPSGILTRKDLDVPFPRADHGGHAVVLTSYNSKSLTFMNSWGNGWARKGFFKVENAEVLRVMKFYDVYWEEGDLSEEEKESYKKSKREAAAKLIEQLKGLQFAKHTCPKCQQESLVTEFTGTLSKVQCPKCFREFSTNDSEGNILALNIYLISLSS